MAHRPGSDDDFNENPMRAKPNDRAANRQGPGTVQR